MSQPRRHGWHSILDWRPGSPWARAAIVLLLVAPIAVAGTMMWALWDPSRYMHDIKLAVVNKDAGVESSGEYTNYGEQIVEGIKDTDYLNFTQLDAAQAQEGLTRGTYMMVVTIPENFSEKAVTIISENPQRPHIEFATNDYYGTNSAIITSSLIPQVQSNVENAVTKNYADKVIDGLNKLSAGLSAAADGATRLDQGAAQLQDGGKQAVAGIAQLDDGAAQLHDGAGQLADGAGQLAGGMDTLATGTGTLADGAGQIEGGVTQLTDMLIPLLTQIQQSAPQLAQAQQALRLAGLNEQANKVGDLANKLDPNNSANILAQLNKLRDGTALLHHNLADPNSQYLGGILQLQDGAHRLADGATQLDDGTSKLKDGTGQLRTGGDALADGLNQLKDGTSELSTKLSDGAKAAPKVTQPDISAQNIAVPIDFTSTNVHPVQTIISHDDPTAKKIDGGASLLIILVFGFLLMLLISLILPYYLGVAAKTRTPVLGAWLIKTAINFLALLVLTLASQLLGWNPASWTAILTTLIAMAASGAAIYQLFQIVFGRAIGGGFGLGFYALGVMVFGGVWPITAVPLFLRAFHFVHPMTYAKVAFARATDGITDSSYWAQLGALTAFTIIALGISIVVLHTRRVGNAQLLKGQEGLKLASS